MRQGGSKIVWRHIRAGRRRRQSDLNVRPIMNLFMILIPCLLMYSSFAELAVIRSAITHQSGQRSDKLKPGLILEMETDAYAIRSRTIDIQKLLQKGEVVAGSGVVQIAKSDPQLLQDNLRKVQTAFPGEREITIMPLRTHSYQEVVALMDIVKEHRVGMQRLPLFPNIAFIEPKGPK